MCRTVHLNPVAVLEKEYRKELARTQSFNDGTEGDIDGKTKIRYRR